MLTSITLQTLRRVVLAAALIVAGTAHAEAAPRREAVPEEESAAKTRMRNRAALLKKSRTRIAVVPVTPEQKRKQSEAKA